MSTLRDATAKKLLDAAAVSTGELTEQDRKDFDKLTGALIGLSSAHQPPAVWSGSLIRDLTTNVHLALIEAGHEAVSRLDVVEALAKGGIVEGAVR